MNEETFENLTALSIRRTQLLGEIISKLESESEEDIPDTLYKEAARKVKGLDNQFFMTEEEMENQRIDEDITLEDLDLDLITVIDNLGLLKVVEDDEE